MRIALALLLAVLVAAAGTVHVLARAETRARLRELGAVAQHVETRHGSLEYAAWGEGPPVLVLHGAGGGFDQGRLLAGLVGGDRRWIAVSRFGYLGSGLPDHPSTSAQAEALADLLDALSIPRADLLAMSGGTPPAMQFAARYPERTGRLVLLSSAPFTPFGPDVKGRPVPTWVYSALLGNDTAYWLLRRLARPALESAFDARPDLRSPPIPEEEAFIAALVDTMAPASRRIAGVMNEGAAVDPAVTYDLEAIAAPTLVVHAEDDRLNPVAVARAMAARIPGARLVTYPTGGHLVLGHHAGFAALARAFLDGG